MINTHNAGEIGQQEPIKKTYWIKSVNDLTKTTDQAPKTTI